MSGRIYTRYELLRAFRNRRFFIFSLGFPLVMFYVIAGPQRNVADFSGTGISAPLYYMVSLASFGTMFAMISGGGRIAAERQAGWTRQLRVTPLPVRAYFGAKMVTSYATAITSLALLYLAGISFGVSLSAHDWLQMSALIIIALLPFGALAILLGHLMTVESIGPIAGGTVSLMAIVSGTWFPATGFLRTVGQWLPSYWLVQAGRVTLEGHGWGTKGWAVVIAWTIVLAGLAGLAYRRDTGRI
ncbi:MAG: ABC transporter permease [Solirubrobacteraceae bacterium]